ETTGDEALLRRVVQEAFASRSGDEALLKLGDLALARGDYAAARGAWQRIDAALTVPPSAAGPPRAAARTQLWLPFGKFDFTGQGGELAPLLLAPRTVPPGVYPETELDPAAVLSRLALASIFEGSGQRAGVESALLRLLYPDAEGYLAGKRGRNADIV